jgi:hypothetical protein
MRKLLTWGLVIFLVYYLVRDPHGASHAAHSGLTAMKSAGNSLAQFVSGL